MEQKHSACSKNWKSKKLKTKALTATMASTTFFKPELFLVPSNLAIGAVSTGLSVNEPELLESSPVTQKSDELKGQCFFYTVLNTPESMNPDWEFSKHMFFILIYRWKQVSFYIFVFIHKHNKTKTNLN